MQRRSPLVRYPLSHGRRVSTVLAESMAVLRPPSHARRWRRFWRCSSRAGSAAPRFVCSRVALCVGAATASRAMRKLSCRRRRVGHPPRCHSGSRATATCAFNLPHSPSRLDVSTRCASESVMKMRSAENATRAPENLMPFSACNAATHRRACRSQHARRIIAQVPVPAIRRNGHHGPAQPRFPGVRLSVLDSAASIGTA